MTFFSLVLSLLPLLVLCFLAFLVFSFLSFPFSFFRFLCLFFPFLYLLFFSVSFVQLTCVCRVRMRSDRYYVQYIRGVVFLGWQAV